jgi:hypothetical protein
MKVRNIWPHDRRQRWPLYVREQDRLLRAVSVRLKGFVINSAFGVFRIGKTLKNVDINPKKGYIQI